MQQPSTPIPARAPTPPAPAPARAAQSPTPAQAALTEVLDPLYRKRAEYTNQLEALKDRREELVDQMEEMRADQQGGHRTRIAVIDERSATLERELYKVDDQIARTVATGAVPAEEGSAVISQMTESDMLREIRNHARSGGEDGAVSALAGAGTFLFFAFIIYKGVRRWIWKRKPAPAVGTGSFDAQQIAQLQRSLDVVAVEVERIAEAQRYTAKMLNDRVLGAGEAQPAHARGVNADPVERR